jgi:hypothetical protein
MRREWKTAVGPGTSRACTDSRAPTATFVMSGWFEFGSECLDRIIPLSGAHLRRSVHEFVQHYRLERNHQGLGNVLIEGPLDPANTNSRVQRRGRLGGLLNFYSRAA